MKTLETKARERLVKLNYKILTYCRIKTRKRNILICLVDDDCGDNFHTYHIYIQFKDNSNRFWFNSTDIERARKAYGEYIKDYVTREYIY